ncbi:MAG: PAS domain-containing protein [SAR202 cluster bacterium]|nr:PAS domain-containing protein [SAR202 cluster bacterium]
MNGNPDEGRPAPAGPDAPPARPSQLDETAARLAELARFPEMNPGPVMRVTHEGTILMANRTALQAFGANLFGNRWPQTCPGMGEELWQGICNSPEMVAVEARTGGRDYVFRHRRDLESNLVFVYGADISELKETQQALKQSEQRFSELARFPDMNPGPVMRVDKDGYILMANRAALSVFGNGLLGKCWPDTCPGMGEEGWKHVQESPDMVAVEARVGDRDYVFRHRHDVQSTLVFVYGAEITELKEAQKALRQSEKLAALGKLSAGLAHELNNPAAAAKRAAAQLAERLAEVERLSLRLGIAGFTEGEYALLRELRDELAANAPKLRDMGPLDRADREEAVTMWLESRSVPEPWMLAPQLAALGVTRLDGLAGSVNPDALADALAWAGKTMAVLELIETVSTSTGSMSELVSAVKSYSYMDRAPEQ